MYKAKSFKVMSRGTDYDSNYVIKSDLLKIKQSFKTQLKSNRVLKKKDNHIQYQLIHIAIHEDI